MSRFEISLLAKILSHIKASLKPASPCFFINGAFLLIAPSITFLNTLVLIGVFKIFKRDEKIISLLIASSTLLEGNSPLKM